MAQRISHYRLLERIGEGGMGLVYKAEDLNLRRVVALKFLRAEAFEDEGQRERFIREAQTTASLDHPNICTIFEIGEEEGQPFIAMAYINGVSLREKIQSGALDVHEIIRICAQAADGLEAAHRCNIFHCDINTSNLMITNEGLVKIMDFGLAEIVGKGDLAKVGKTYGTMGFMAPEQVRGDAVDQRTDVWALGVCMYQMLSGSLPFIGEYEPAVFYSILNEDPKPVSTLRPDVPPALAAIVEKALSKNRGDRFQYASHLSEELKSLLKQIEMGSLPDHPDSNDKPAIAVLPFANMSTDPEQEFFCDGIAEDIINGLTQLEGLRVVARTSAFAFKARSEDVRQIGRDLNIDVILEGSVRKWGDKLRITAQLVNVEDGYHLWSERFDRQLEDVFAIQDEISQAIVKMLKVQLIGSEEKEIVRHHTENVDAYTNYLKGRFYWNKRNEAGLRTGIEYFQRAIDNDPKYGIAYAGLADSYNLLGFYCAEAPRDVFPQAKKAAERALEMDADMAESYASLGFTYMFFDWDWRGAERAFKRSIELSPRYPTAHHWYAEYLVLVGRPDEGVEQSKRALASDPLSLIINTLLGWVPYFHRDYVEAVRQYEKTLQMDSRFVPAHFFLGLAYLRLSRYDEAITHIQRSSALFGRSGLFDAARAYALACAGRRGQAEESLEGTVELATRVYVPACFIAATYMRLGRPEDAFLWLDRAFEEHDIWLGFLKVDPAWDDVRQDPRFISLLRKVGLADTSALSGGS